MLTEEKLRKTVNESLRKQINQMKRENKSMQIQLKLEHDSAELKHKRMINKLRNNVVPLRLRLVDRVCRDKERAWRE